MASLFRERDFVLLWAGQSVSGLGSAVTYVALPLVAVVVLHASTFEVSVVTAASSIAWLIVGLPAGVWVDRLPHRSLLITADLGRAALMATIPVAWLVHALTLAHVVSVAFAVGLLTVLFDVGYQVYLPPVVGRERLIEGNATLAASESAANVVGPSLGGVLVQLTGAPVAILADAISFLVSAVSLTGIRATGTPAGRRPARQRLTQEIGAGLRYVLSHPLARTVAIARTLGNLVLSGYQAVIFVFLARQVGLSAALIGGLLALSSVGGLLGALAASPLAKRLGNTRVMWAAPAVMATFGLLIPLTGTGAALAWYLAGALPLSLGLAAFNVSVRSAMQIAAPDTMLGKVTATFRLLGRATVPVGALGAGTLADAITPRATLVILMVLLALVPAWLLFSPLGRVREVAQLAPPVASPLHQALG